MRAQCFVLSVIIVTLFGLSSTAHGSLRDQGQIFGTVGALELVLIPFTNLGKRESKQTLAPKSQDGPCDRYR